MILIFKTDLPLFLNCGFQNGSNTKINFYLPIVTPTVTLLANRIAQFLRAAVSGCVVIRWSARFPPFSSLKASRKKPAEDETEGERHFVAQMKGQTKHFCCASVSSASDGEINLWPTECEEASQIEKKSCMHGVLKCYFLLQNAKLYGVSPWNKCAICISAKHK